MADKVRKIDTGDLERSLKNSIDLSEFLKENEDAFVENDLSSLLQEVISEKKMSKALVARKSNMSKVYLFQILNGSRTPSRDRVLCLCIGLELNVRETQALLKRACYGELYVKSRRDSIILYGIKEHWNLDKINDVLFDEGEETLL